MNQIKVGDMAPDFALKDQNGAEVKLSDFRGQTCASFLASACLDRGM